MEKEQIPS